MPIFVAKDFVDAIPYEINIGVVSFSGSSYIEQDVSLDKSDIKNAIGNIELSGFGGTDLYEAVITSTNLLENEENKAIVLLSDGQINVGTIGDAIDYANENDVIIHTIAMGTKEGAWDIGYKNVELGVNQANYINHIGKTPTIQALIDRCQCAIGAVGSQSAPPKIMLLQDVPTFMIGHTRKRHQEEENWGKAKCGFWEIGFVDYNKFYSWECIDKIVEFFKGIHEKS